LATANVDRCSVLLVKNQPLIRNLDGGRREHFFSNNASFDSIGGCAVCAGSFLDDERMRMRLWGED
jgi:hypothetical protein